jgi:hypothetical protein
MEKLRLKPVHLLGRQWHVFPQQNQQLAVAMDDETKTREVRRLHRALPLLLRPRDAARYRNSGGLRSRRGRDAHDDDPRRPGGSTRLHGKPGARRSGDESREHLARLLAGAFFHCATGNHQVVIYGDYVDALRDLCGMLEMELIEPRG